MTLEEARKIVFDKKPTFAELYFKYKDKTWGDYIRENYYNNTLPENTRTKELTKILEEIISPILGQESSDKAIKTLRETGFVSTCDHSGILCHPFFSNIALARQNESKEEQAVLCFTCGGVSLTNSSYPRGIFFHDNDLQEKRIPLVSLRGRRRSIYGLPSFSRTKIQSIMDTLPNFKISKKQQDRMIDFFCDIWNNKKIFSLSKFSDQLIIINNLLWKKIFKSEKSELIYIEAEHIVRKLLLEIHLEKQTLINDLLFNKECRTKYIKYFENITGAHYTTKHFGSHFFWYIDEITNTRTQLFLEGENLVSIDRKISIPMRPEIIREYLLRFELLPTMAFCYSILSFYYGLTLGGGFSQIQYLDEMKKAWQEIFGKNDIDPKTDIFAGEFVLLGLSNKKQTLPATLIDLLLYSDDKNTDTTRALKESSIGDTIDAMMEELVKIVTGKKPHIENLKIHKTLNV